MGSFFYLASLIFYVKSRLLPFDTRRKFYYTCSLMAALAAMFCKEFTVTLPFMLVMYEFYFLKPKGTLKS